MAVIRKVKIVKPVCAVTFAKEVDLDSVTLQLEKIFGPIETSSKIYSFNYTNYYTKEMGIGLKKFFTSFVNLQNPDFLAGIKVKTNKIEEFYAIDGRRRINLDPGYLTSAKLIIASAKDFAHRIYIGKGIYGDLQLQYRHGEFWPESWTFPDYKTKIVTDFFKGIRKKIAQEENK